MSSSMEADGVVEEVSTGSSHMLEGTVLRDENDMTHFGAENLEEKIKMFLDSSHPHATSSPHGSQLLVKKQSRSLDMPETLEVLNDIEVQAQFLATSVDSLTENLCNLLHSISSICESNVALFRNSVNKLTDTMDANIKIMYTIMAKTEEINKKMKETEEIYQKIKDIRRLVEMLENVV